MVDVLFGKARCSIRSLHYTARSGHVKVRCSVGSVLRTGGWGWLQRVFCWVISLAVHKIVS